MARWAVLPVVGAALAATAAMSWGWSGPTLPPPGDWWSYGRDEGGSRYSSLSEISPANVSRLAPLWVYELKPADRPAARLLVSSHTPLAVDGTLFLATPYGRVVALDGDTGAQRWSYALPGDDGIAGRGMDYWPGDAQAGPRLFFGTRSGKLLALDPRTGTPAAGFQPIELRTPAIMNGTDGGGYPAGYTYQINSAPVLYRNVLITGARLQESPAQGPAGDIRGWDARTGKLLWTFHSVPQAGERFHETWAVNSGARRSGVNAWSALAVDPERGIVYVPFGAPAYDRIGVDRAGANLFSSSLVALDAQTGRYLWHFQAVHHDIWDLDMPVQPTLMDVRRGGKTVPAVVAMNKSGYLFVLNRVTGKPLFPVTETPMPVSAIPGEQAWPTQPIPSAPRPLIRQAITMADIAKLTPEHEAFCRARVAKEHASFAVPFEPLRTDRPVVRLPGSGGGPNWGGGAFDAGRGLYVINTSELASIEQMGRDAKGNWYNVAAQPSWFGMGGLRMPCQRPPWGNLTAVDVGNGRILWQVPLGVTDALPPTLRATGRPNVGGPLATASGLIFIGASDDRRFRAFDTRSGRELWAFRLGASAHATPISYRGRSGRQYVAVVSAGGGYVGSPNSASRLVVFGLPRRGEANVAAVAATSQAPVRELSVDPHQVPVQRVAASGDASQFAPGPEQATVQRACTACHVSAQVTSQRKTRGDWAATVEQMIGFGAHLSDAEVDRVVDYLARNYPAAD